MKVLGGMLPVTSRRRTPVQWLTNSMVRFLKNLNSMKRYRSFYADHSGGFIETASGLRQLQKGIRPRGVK